MTVAPCSMLASATQKPMPDVPPKMTTRFPASLEVYKVLSGMMSDVGGEAIDTLVV